VEAEIWHLSDEWEQRIRAQYKAAAPMLWRRMIGEWKSGTFDDCFWLAGASSYLVSLADTRWMVDPVQRDAQVFAACREHLAKDLGNLSFILYTHAHNDHYQPEWDAALGGSGIVRVVPSFMRGIYREVAETAYVVPGDTLTLSGCRITVLPGSHKNPEEIGPDAVMYLVEGGGRRLFFSGDVRNPEPDRIPAVGPVDCLFYHVFLGKNSAKKYPWPDWLEAVCRQVASIPAQRIFLGHLYEMMSESDRLYTYLSAGAVMDGLGALCPTRDVVIPQLGRRYSLGP